MTVVHLSIMFYEQLKVDNFCPQNELLPEKQKLH